MGLRYDEISEILKIIDSSSCDEFVLETNDIKLVVRRHGADGSVPSAAPSVAPAPARAPAPSPQSSQPQQASAAAPQAATAQVGAGQTVVTAPMVGTFYRAPSPTEPPFVEVGSVVKAGDPLCIIEVMKLFTTIHAECDGRIAQIGAENAMLVEYGQTLFVIDPV